MADIAAQVRALQAELAAVNECIAVSERTNAGATAKVRVRTGGEAARAGTGAGAGGRPVIWAPVRSSARVIAPVRRPAPSAGDDRDKLARGVARQAHESV